MGLESQKGWQVGPAEDADALVQAVREIYRMGR